MYIPLKIVNPFIIYFLKNSGLPKKAKIKIPNTLIIKECKYIKNKQFETEIHQSKNKK